MTPELITALRLLRMAAKGHPNVTNFEIQEINMFLADIEKKYSQADLLDNSCL